MANDPMTLMSADERVSLIDMLVVIGGEVRILLSLLAPELEPGVEWEPARPHLRLVGDAGVEA